MRIFHHRLALLSLVFLLGLSLAAILAPFLTQFSYEIQNITDALQGPSRTYWMGTDSLGRDLYSRILYGARVSLAVGVITSGVALVMGTILGLLAGYFGGWIDQLIVGLVDLFTIFPSTLLAILFSLLLGRGLSGILLALALTSWVTQARIVRGQVLREREMTYIEAARALGLRDFRILFRHILPNIFGAALVAWLIQIPTNIMSESFLSFIGLGLQPPYASWGTLANEGFRGIQSFPHLIIFPGLILFLTTLAFHFLGEFLQTRSR